MALKRITNFGKNSIVASDRVSHARATDVVNNTTAN
ncbi:hypothetical protein BSPWISOXPB_7300 [uncultured Gammaproteobacteria bacterium]|jgi:hypothetical protein|nr:hypothetical protein BSPWISOXPB_7300 [uncultured Gammaproteobacteria bacterium]